MRIYLSMMFIILGFCFPQKILIPMDHTQTDHLKAYGLVFSLLIQFKLYVKNIESLVYG